MLRIEATRREIDLAAYKQRSAHEGDYGHLVAEPCEVYQDGRLVIVYLELAGDPEVAPVLDRIAATLPRVKYTKDARTDGLVTTSRTFGFKPRNVLRHDFCSAAGMASEQPAEHAVIVAGAAVAGRYYRQHNPELYAHHAATVDDRIRPEYHFEDEVFTSGIINDNNPLKYHFDTGNFRDVWSGMLAFRNGTAGGYLAMPEYDLAIAIADRSLLLFDGQSILHGVTPIVKLKPNATRYSIVYYSLKEMWNCAPLDEEIVRIRRLRTQREAQVQRQVERKRERVRP